jgi:GNAT superfamily N-acetyltransferase
VDVNCVNGYTIETNRERLNRSLIHSYLSKESYWAHGRSLSQVEVSLKNSLCFGVFDAIGEQVGFARVVTDYATFGWLADVFVLPDHRGKGLAKWLVQTIVTHPDLQCLTRLMLGTRDAQELYRNYGQFSTVAKPENWMERNMKELSQVTKGE